MYTVVVILWVRELDHLLIRFGLIRQVVSLKVFLGSLSHLVCDVLIFIDVRFFEFCQHD
jgi:hypothetical protein